MRTRNEIKDFYTKPYANMTITWSDLKIEEELRNMEMLRVKINRDNIINDLLDEK